MTAGESRILDNLLTQAVSAINSGDKAEALTCINQALLTTAALDQAPDVDEASTETADASDSIKARIQGQRDELFGVEAAIGVAQRSVNPDQNYDLWRVLGDAYAAIDAIAGELDDIATDARSAGGSA